LFAQLPGQPRLEIFPRSENEFFWKAIEAEVTFVRDRNGNGRTAEAPRLD
jgi:hypothetical protein